MFFPLLGELHLLNPHRPQEDAGGLGDCNLNCHIKWLTWRRLGVTDLSSHFPPTNFYERKAKVKSEAKEKKKSCLVLSALVFSSAYVADAGLSEEWIMRISDSFICFIQPNGSRAVYHGARLLWIDRVHPKFCGRLLCITEWNVLKMTKLFILRFECLGARQTFAFYLSVSVTPVLSGLSVRWGKPSLSAWASVSSTKNISVFSSGATQVGCKACGSSRDSYAWKRIVAGGWKQTCESVGRGCFRPMCQFAFCVCAPPCLSRSGK